MTESMHAGLQESSVRAVYQGRAAVAKDHSLGLLSMKALKLGYTPMLLLNTQAWCEGASVQHPTSCITAD